ncbi:MAG: CBS domain-containing protein, partial [Firmicutes bacterium]|nr:CBS domain-containing protein [Bacillota bacterium]
TRYGYTCVPVLDQEEHYVGCISEGDFLRHMLATGSTDKKFHEQFHLNEIMRKESSPALHIQADAAEMLLAIMNQNFLPVVDDRNFLCGIVTRRSVITELSRRLTNS